MRRALIVGTGLLLSALLTGCAGNGEGARSPHSALAPDGAVTDDAFAGAVRDLLESQPGTKERSMRLTGVEARQMARAAARFRNHDVNRGVAALTGGLYLFRPGELSANALGSSGKDALSAGAKEFATRGDEGRAQALYELLLLTSSGDKKEIQSHIDALGGWVRDGAAKYGPVRASHELQSIAVGRRLFEPTDNATLDASNRTIQWVQAGLALRNAFRDRRMPASREEGFEAFGALQTGTRTLAAIHLLGADARGALAAIDRGQLREFVRPDLITALERTGDRPNSDRWLDVLRALRPPSSREQQDEEPVLEDRELFRAASWAVAIEAYRLDPTLPEAAGAVAAGLQEYGMAEASAAVLLDAAKAHPDTRTLGGALSIVMHAMQLEIEGEDVGAARRAYNAAAPLLAMADAAKSRTDPSPGQVRAMMGEIELREGRVAEARELLKSASQADKSGGVLATLARIERFDGQLPQATAHLKEALASPDVSHDPALRGELQLTLGDIALEQGNAASARASYTDALNGLARGRAQGEPEDRARVERVLAQVLDRFGAAQPAHKALERAYDNAPRDKQQVSATLGLVVGRALVHSDLPSARDGLRRALGAELDQDDVVYLALWVRLLERQLRAQPDGAAEKVFASIPDDGRWIGRLSAFGGGRIKADELISSAKTPAQKTEALFYAALDKRVAGDQRGAEAAFHQVLKTGGIGLMEVALTRDILNQGRAPVGPLPQVTLP